MEYFHGFLETTYLFTSKLLLFFFMKRRVGNIFNGTGQGEEEKKASSGRSFVRKKSSESPALCFENFREPQVSPYYYQ